MTRLTHPDELTDERIHSIGKRYLGAHKKPSGLFGKLFSNSDKRSRAIAIDLTNFTSDCDVHAKWLYLANLYGKLTNDDPIAIDIFHTFSTAYNTNLYIHKLIHDKEKINRVIDDYGKEYSVEETSAMLKIVADSYYLKSLKKEAHSINPSFDADNAKAPSLAENPTAFSNVMLDNLLNKIQPRFFTQSSYPDSHERWTALAKGYGRLQESSGPVSDAILKLFYDAFGKTVYTRRFSAGSNPVKISTSQIAEALANIADTWYADQYRQSIRLSQGSLTLARDLATLHESEPSESRMLMVSPVRT